MTGTRERSISLALLIVHLCGTEGITPSQVVPQGIESINGSNATMGCTVPLETINGVTTCGSPGNTGYSYLVDGCSPHVNTHHHDWASQLVTVRMIESSNHLNFPHALLTFGFDTPVSITGMQIDMFNCPDWKIGFDYALVYLNQEKNLTFSGSLPFVHQNYQLQSSCDCLSTVTFSGGSFLVGYYHTVHILIDFTVYEDKFEWVVLGEVRFLNVRPQPILPSSVKTVLPTKSSSIPHSMKSSPAISSSLLPTTSVSGDSCPSSEEFSTPALIAVSAASLLLITTFTTVILAQCLLIIRMRRRSRNNAVTLCSTTTTTDVCVSPNEAYGLTKRTNPTEEDTYAIIN